jgi:hypothetical protein
MDADVLLFTDPILLVTEYPVYGSLIDYLRDLRKGFTNVHFDGHSNYSLTHEIMSFATQIARGMAYLSSLKVSRTLSRIQIQMISSLRFYTEIYRPGTSC